MITHLSKKNKPQIIDISNKEVTKRTATAQGSIIFSKKTFKKLEKMQTKKGEITNVAILAGIMGAKKTSELIPLCHNIDITNVDIKITTNKKLSNLVINASVKSTSKTGVEMEALTAVSISCLTIYDMCKSLDKNIIIDKIKLISKKGGKSDYLND